MTDVTPTTPGDADPEDAFEVSFECGNCGDEWSETFPARIRVERQSTGINHAVKAAPPNAHSLAGDSIACPTCELIDPVRIEDRRPLEDGTDD